MKKTCLTKPLYLIILLMLSGCLLKTTRIIDKQGFAEMVYYVSPILQDRDIISDKKNYFEPLLPELTHPLPENVGEYLFFSLPSNLQKASEEEAFLTFSQNTNIMLLSMEPFGFTAQQSQQVITVKLLAQLDWKNKGNNDWLIQYRTKSLYKKSFVDYYLIVTPDISNPHTLEPTIIALCDSTSNTCTILANFIKNEYKEKNHTEFSFIEVEPGFLSIFHEKNKPQEKEPTITEETLKE